MAGVFRKRRAIQGPFRMDAPTKCSGRRRPNAGMACRYKTAWQDPSRDKITGCAVMRRPEGAWARRCGQMWQKPLPVDAPIRCIDRRRLEAAWACRCREASEDPARKMCQLGAPAGDKQRRRGRIDERRHGRSSSGEIHQLGAPVRDSCVLIYRGVGGFPPWRFTNWVCL